MGQGSHRVCLRLPLDLTNILLSEAPSVLSPQPAFLTPSKSGKGWSMDKRFV